MGVSPLTYWPALLSLRTVGKSLSAGWLASTPSKVRLLLPGLGLEMRRNPEGARASAWPVGRGAAAGRARAVSDEDRAIKELWVKDQCPDSVQSRTARSPERRPRRRDRERTFNGKSTLLQEQPNRIFKSSSKQTLVMSPNPFFGIRIHPKSFTKMTESLAFPDPKFKKKDLVRILDKS